MLVACGAWSISLNGSSQAYPPPLLGAQVSFAVGGGLVQSPELAMLPFTFQVTTADLMLKPEKGAKAKWSAVPAKLMQTLEVARALLAEPMEIRGHCSDQKPSSGSWKVSWSGIATPARLQSLRQTS
jgi:hypothetical protein